MMKVILTDAYGEIGSLVKDSLERIGAEIFIFASSLKIKDERNYINELISFQKSVGAEMIIPIFFPEVLSRHRDEFPGVVIPLDSEEHISLLDNKLKACALAESLGLRLPRQYRSVEDVDRYPVVFKRICGHGGDSVYFPKHPDALRHLVGASLPGTYLITDEIEGGDVCVDAIRWKGFFFAAAYEVLLPRAKGVSILRRSIDSPELVDYARKMLEAADYQGACGMDFRKDRQGRFWFLECNPRFSGGLASQIASGFDSPALLCRLATGAEIASSEVRFRSGVITGDKTAIREYIRRRRRQGKLDLRDIRLGMLRFLL